MVVIFNIIESVKIIDKEINKLDKKSDKEIDELYAKEFEKTDPKVNLLYQIFEKEYKIKLFESKLKSILKKNKLSIDYLSFLDDIDYIKNLGYTKVTKVGSGAYGTVYLVKKNKKKYAIKMQKFDTNYYGEIEKFLESNINEYKKLKKLSKYSISPKVYDIKFIFNENKMEVYSLIFMEHIDGITLSQYKEKKGPLNDSDNKKLNEKVAKMHKLGIYHRDLHDKNIIIIKKDKNIDFIIIDMGLSKSSKNIINNAKKSNKYMLEGFIAKKSDENKKLYIALANTIKNGEIHVIS
jgi:tRNA A-37 threonylcarbamoyl transferase component Bud32